MMRMVGIGRISNILFYEELITKEEFNQRLMMSTCLIKTKNKNKNDK